MNREALIAEIEKLVAELEAAKHTVDAAAKTWVTINGHNGRGVDRAAIEASKALDSAIVQYRHAAAKLSNQAVNSFQTDHRTPAMVASTRR